MDLSNGFEAYAAVCSAARTERIKLRRLEGSWDCQLITSSNDREMLRLALEWKSAQLAPGCISICSWWIGSVRLSEGIHVTLTSDFAGILSVL